MSTQSKQARAYIDRILREHFDDPDGDGFVYGVVLDKIEAAIEPLLPEPEWEWQIRHNVGVFPCRDEDHARAMLRTTSPVLGEPESRVLQRRPFVAGAWEDVVTPRQEPRKHGWDSKASLSGVGVCLCGWKTQHYAVASDPDLDREFDQHLIEVGA